MLATTVPILELLVKLFPTNKERTSEQKEESNTEDATNDYVVESIDAILDIAKNVYNEELERFNQIENKTNIGMAFAGVLLGVVITFYSAGNMDDIETPQIIYTWVFRLISLILVCIGISFFHLSMKTGQYNQFPINTFIDNKYLKEEEYFVKVELAASYNRVVQDNQNLLVRKIRKYDLGSLFVLLGFLAFILNFILEVVIKNVG